MQKVCSQEAGVTEVPFPCQGPLAGEPARELPHVAGDGVQLLVGKSRARPYAALAAVGTLLGASRGARPPDGEESVVQVVGQLETRRAPEIAVGIAPVKGGISVVA